MLQYFIEKIVNLQSELKHNKNDNKNGRHIYT